MRYLLIITLKENNKRHSLNGTLLNYSIMCMMRAIIEKSSIVIISKMTEVL